MGEQVAAGSIKNITEAKAAVRTVPDAEVVYYKRQEAATQYSGSCCYHRSLFISDMSVRQAGDSHG